MPSALVTGLAIAGYNLITVNQCRLCDLRADLRVTPAMNQIFLLYDLLIVPLRGLNHLGPARLSGQAAALGIVRRLLYCCGKMCSPTGVEKGAAVLPSA